MLQKYCNIVKLQFKLEQEITMSIRTFQIDKFKFKIDILVI